MLLWRLNLQGHRNSKHKAKIGAERSHEEDTTRRRKRASRKAVPTGSTSSDANSMAPSNSHRSPPQQSNTTVPYVRATFRAVDDEPIAPTAPLPPMQFEPTMDSQNQTSDANTSQWQNEDHSGLPNIQESAITGVSLLSVPHLPECTVALDKGSTKLTRRRDGQFSGSSLGAGLLRATIDRPTRPTMSARRSVPRGGTSQKLSTPSTPEKNQVH